jgi:hypothetical protein
MEKIRTRDGNNSDPVSGINIPDPQHCKLYRKKTSVSDKFGFLDLELDLR